MKLSVIIVTYNEEENITACLESVDFADEIIVVDSFSIDSTKELAEKKGAGVIQTEVRYPEQKKNMGIDAARNEWILVLDADERVTPELKQEVTGILNSPGSEAYSIRRKNYFMGKHIRYCGWGRDRVVRLFKKGYAKYPDKRVHGALELKGRPGVLKNVIEHYSYRNFEDYFIKVNRYTRWSAKDSEGKKVKAPKLFINPFFRFIKMYFLNLGFLDGVAGFILCVAASFSVFIKYARIYFNSRGRL